MHLREWMEATGGSSGARVAALAWAAGVTPVSVRRILLGGRVTHLGCARGIAAATEGQVSVRELLLLTETDCTLFRGKARDTLPETPPMKVLRKGKKSRENAA